MDQFPRTTDPIHHLSFRELFYGRQQQIAGRKVVLTRLNHVRLLLTNVNRVRDVTFAMIVIIKCTIACTYNNKRINYQVAGPCE